MGSRRADWIEGGADGGAALLFALAIGFVLLRFGVDPALVLAVPALSFAACLSRLRRISPEGGSKRYAFQPAEFVLRAGDELLLTSHQPINREELALDRPLADAAPGSTVVHLFKTAAVPTPGKLGERIGRHLAQSSGVTGNGATTASGDASQALFSALSELRRSLR